MIKERKRPTQEEELLRRNCILKDENARLRTALGIKEERLRGKCADPNMVRKDPCGSLRNRIECMYATSRERSLALTKLDECEMWLERCNLQETAAPATDYAAERADSETCRGLGRRSAAMGIPDMGSILGSAVD